MSQPDSPPSDAEPTRADALARQLERVAQELTQLAQRAGNAAARETLIACPGALTVVSAGLRGLAGAVEAGRTDLLVARRRELNSLLSGIARGLATLAEASQRTLVDVGDRVRHFEAASKVPPTRQLVVHLRGIAQGMQHAVDELGGRLKAAATQAHRATQRAATLAERSQPPPPPQPRSAETGFCGRDAFDERLEADVATAPFRGPWSLVLVEIDRLDDVTERSSALACDELLARITRMVAARIRRKCPEAFAAEFDDGVFAAIVPGDRAFALALAEDVRRGVASVRWTFTGQQGTTDLTTTASIGLAPYRPGDTVATLLDRTTHALHQARHDGVNAAE